MKSVLSGSYQTIRSALFAPKYSFSHRDGTELLWEPKHFIAVVEAIVQSRHYAIPDNEACKVIEKVGLNNGQTGYMILLSMARCNALALRRYDRNAKDIPREAFGGKNREWWTAGSVVTMSSPPQLHAALDMYANGELTEE